MTTSLIPFDTAKAPATLAAFFGGSSDLLGSNAGGGFPVVSIKGKIFHIQRGDERTLVTKPGEEDPAAAIEVVILKANPNRSKVYYAHGYQEGNVDKPTCYSNNGISPEADAQEPQANKCATCVHNQWGSKVTENGAKGKACSDSRRLAISTVDTPNDPMLLRVPAASMRALEDFAKQLNVRNVPYQAVVTRIGFDYSVAYPLLTFRPMGIIGDKDKLHEIREAAEADVVQQIAGIKPMGSAQSEVAEAAAPAVKKAEAVQAAVATAAKTKKVEVAVEDKPKAAKPTKAADTPVDAISGEISELIDGLDLDD